MHQVLAPQIRSESKSKNSKKKEKLCTQFSVETSFPYIDYEESKKSQKAIFLFFIQKSVSQQCLQRVVYNSLTSCFSSG